MASAAGADGLFRSVFEGCLSGCDMGIERRPYHRNCGCALHKLRKNCPHDLKKNNSVKYPIRRAWSEGSLVMAAAAASSGSSSPAASPTQTALEAGRSKRLGFFTQEDDDEEYGRTIV